MATPFSLAQAEWALLHTMKRLALMAAPGLLAACAAIPGGPIVDSPREVAARGTLVPILQPVWVTSDVVVTAMRVIEDSRCAENARCVWAGRAVVETRIDGPGWRQTVPLTLGEEHSVRDIRLALVAVQPERRSEPRLETLDYRFAYELR